MRRQQKAAEKAIVRAFLENVLALHVLRLVGRNPSRYSHPADIYAVVERDGGTAVLEIELVEYQVDASDGQEGGSPGERLNSFWRKVQDSICRRLSKNPVEVDARVTLKHPTKVKQKDAQGLAGELVRFVRGFSFAALEPESLTVFPEELPLMAEYVQILTLTKVSHYSIVWTCTDASVAFVGVSPRHVASLIRRKGKKDYTWTKDAEKWLLVCASGRSVFGRAGSQPAPATWQDPELQAACIASPFDRIYFSDLPRRWYEQLK
jgi:hypothetical protein